jgi:Zn-dependent protease
MDIIITLFLFLVLIFSIILHELAHGNMAYSLGDPTAKYEGRLTLNPLKHLDPFGSVILPLLLFMLSLGGAGAGFILGWAKPVPVNPYNFKDQKYGQLKVALAGPASNIALAIIFGLFLRLIPANLFILLPGMSLIFFYIVRINLMLAIFNLLPIPPLDGSWILFNFLPDKFAKIKMFLQQYGLFILIFLLFSGGLSVLDKLINFLMLLIIGT